MTARVLLATRNEKKLVELRRILSPLVQVEVVGLDDVAGEHRSDEGARSGARSETPPFDEVPETGATFAENALIKARAAFANTAERGFVTVADDSGLCVDALNGMPGVLSARWAGHAKDDIANLELVLAQIADVPDERLGAHFECAIAVLVPPPGGPGSGAPAEHVVHGRMRGHIVRTPRGAGGFGYDPIFVPEDHSRTSAELNALEKDAVSHRGRALRELAPLLVPLLRG